MSGKMTALFVTLQAWKLRRRLVQVKLESLRVKVRKENNHCR